MSKKGIISLQSSGNDSSITFNEVREDDLTINRVSKFLEKQNEIKTAQFEAVVKYITNNTRCKSRLILDYFDEENSSDCGICSYCITKNKPVQSPLDLANAILTLLKGTALDSREIESRLEATPQETIAALQMLLDSNRITITTNNQYTLK